MSEADGFKVGKLQCIFNKHGWAADSEGYSPDSAVAVLKCTGMLLCRNIKRLIFLSTPGKISSLMHLHMFFSPLFFLLVFAVINETIHYTFTGCCSFKLQDHIRCFVVFCCALCSSPRSNNAQKRGHTSQDWMMTEDLRHSIMVKLKARDRRSFSNKMWNRTRRLTNFQHTVWNYHSAGRRW